MEPQPSLKPVLVTTSRHAVSFAGSPQCSHITRGQVHVSALSTSARAAQAQRGMVEHPTAPRLNQRLWPQREAEDGERTEMHNITIPAARARALQGDFSE